MSPPPAFCETKRSRQYSKVDVSEADSIQRLSAHSVFQQWYGGAGPHHAPPRLPVLVESGRKFDGGSV